METLISNKLYLGIALWVLLAAGVGIWAQIWRHRGFLWFLGSLFVTPILGIILLSKEGKKRYRIKKFDPDKLTKRCPKCLIEIPLKAKRCFSCETEFNEAEVKRQIMARKEAFMKTGSYKLK